MQNREKIGISAYCARETGLVYLVEDYMAVQNTKTFDVRDNIVISTTVSEDFNITL